MTNTAHEIAKALGVISPFADRQALEAEIKHRIRFIQETLRQSGLETLVLGISGGIDSTLAGRLAQLAAEGLRKETGEDRYRFIALRLPYQTQQDAADAKAALDFIRPDERLEINMAGSVMDLARQVPQLESLAAARRDFVVGNIKARCRMVAQYAVANATNGLVIGTDHAAEAVMGFYTKFGDGACDLTPLAGLVKGQIRAMAHQLGAPDSLVHKIPTADLEDLHPGKPDEEAYGVSYEQIDAFLHGQEVDESVKERIIRAWKSSAHKRRLPLTPADLQPSPKLP